MSDEELPISEVSERTGLGVHTLRYYEQEGLLPGSVAHSDGTTSSWWPQGRAANRIGWSCCGPMRSVCELSRHSQQRTSA